MLKAKKPSKKWKWKKLKTWKMANINAHSMLITEEGNLLQIMKIYICNQKWT